MSNLEGIYNTSAFDGSVTSDFLEIGTLSDTLKAQYIDYSVADFSEYKEALEAYLRAVYPDDFNNFIESDLGIMLVDLFAYLAGVLSLKADSLVNEMFLPTVKSKGNLLKLLQLIGVTMKGPISAKTSAVLVLPDEILIDEGSGHTITINFADRVHSVVNTKDAGNLSYTLYQVDKTTGSLDVTSPNIVQTDALSIGDGKSFDNLILVEGELKKVRGTFSTTNTVQTVDISEASVAEGSIVVSAQDQGVYTEIDNLFLADSGSSLVFQKVYNDDDSATVIFGDGVRGLSPLPGTLYDLYYRVGGGNRGNVPRNSLSVTIPCTHTTKGTSNGVLSNTTHATGGQNAESVEHAKKWAPYTFKTQHRAVTGEDYTTFANQFISTAGATGKAQAVLRRSGAASNMVDIFVIAKATDNQIERSNITYKQELLDYINQYKMVTDHVTIVDALVRTIDLSITIHIDRELEYFEEEVKRAVADRITSYFDLTNRSYGELFTLADLRRDIHLVSDVRFSEIGNLDKDIKLNFNEIIQLNNLEINVEFV